MGIREYARHRGLSHTTVQHAIRDGRIQRRPDGKIDRAQADQDWVRNTDQARPRNSLSGDPHRRRGPDGMPLPMASAGDAGAPPEVPKDERESYARARARRETVQASKAELSYLMESSQLLLREDVSDHAFRRARAARDALMTLCPRIAPILAAESDRLVVQGILENAMREICELLSHDADEDATNDPAEPFQLTPPVRRRR